MKKKITYKFLSCMLAIFVLSTVAVCYLINTNLSERVFDIENDYKLKFVDSTDYKLNLAGTEKVLLPSPILNMSEKAGKIKIEVLENSVIYAPIDCKVSEITSDGAIVLTKNKIKCKLFNLIVGVIKNKEVEVGEVIGSVNGSYLYAEVFYGKRKLSLDEIKGLI